MRVFLILMFLFLIQTFAFSQNERLKSLFVYNFAKNIEWPARYNEGDFVITALGNSTIYDELQQNVKGKRIGNQTVQVRHAAQLSDVGKCHILYITFQESDMIEAVGKRLRGTSTVIVTEKNGMIGHGADINIIECNGKLRFEIDPTRLEKKRIIASQKLLEMGIKHESEDTKKKQLSESPDDTHVPR